MSANLKHLHRIPQRGVIAGVCVGVADHFDWNVKLLRALAIVGVLCGLGSPIVLYLVLWYVMDPLTSAEASSLPEAGTSPPPRGPSMPSMNEVKARFAKLDDRLRSIEECVTEKEFELRRELKKLEA